jgi:uncharacterized membrane protein YphA (DoxX/SURF4 family)
MRPEFGAKDMLLVGVRLLIAGVLLRAAFGKVRARSGATTVVSLLLQDRHARFASVLASCVVGAEIVAGFALLASVALSFTAVAVTVMMVAFSLALVSLRMRGADGCGCFGDDATYDGEDALARNVILALGAGAIAVGARVWPGANSNLPVWRIGVSQLLPGILLAGIMWLCWCVISMFRSVYAGTSVSHDE